MIRESCAGRALKSVTDELSNWLLSRAAIINMIMLVLMAIACGCQQFSACPGCCKHLNLKTHDILTYILVSHTAVVGKLIVSLDSTALSDPRRREFASTYAPSHELGSVASAVGQSQAWT